MIIMLAGLPGTGKSALAQELALALSGVILDKDRIRAALFPTARITYTTDQDDFCLSVMLQTATYLLGQHPDEPVILDGRTFSRTYQVQMVEQHAAHLHVPLVVIECTCADQTARRRLEQDVAAGRHLASNRTYALYQSIKARFEPIREPKLIVNTDQPLRDVVAQCLASIRTQHHPSISTTQE
jgi:predicted kinase